MPTHTDSLAALHAALLAWRRVSPDAIPNAWLEALERQLLLNRWQEAKAAAGGGQNAGSDASASPPIASTGLVGTDTPRTDAVSMRGDCDRHAANGACLCVDLLNMAEHARQLERELNALRANSTICVNTEPRP